MEGCHFLQVQKKALNFVSDIEESLKMNHEVTVWLHKELKNVCEKTIMNYNVENNNNVLIM